MAKLPKIKVPEHGAMLNLHRVEDAFGHKSITVDDHIHKDRKGKLF